MRRIVHDAAELRREERLVRRDTRASLMSDTKWRKVFEVLTTPDLGVRRCIWKFVGRDSACPDNLSAGLYLSWPWIDTIAFGPIPLRSIEWLWIPRRTKSGRRIQDVDRAERMIAGLGRYPIELNERGLLIRGYLGKGPSEAEVELAEALPVEA